MNNNRIHNMNILYVHISINYIVDYLLHNRYPYFILELLLKTQLYLIVIYIIVNKLYLLIQSSK